MKKKSNKYEQILEGAADVFLDVGYEKATIKEIAMRSGVGKGTIYEYFKSKDELFTEFVKDGVPYVINEVMRIIESSKTLDDVLLKMKVGTLRILDEHLKKVELSFQDFRFSSKELQDWIIQQGNELTDNMADFLAGLIKKGEIRHVHAAVASTMVLDMLRISLVYKMTDNRENIEEILDAKIDILRRGLLK